VSVPKETIWQDLRSECLSAIPRESRLSISRPKNLAEWQKLGFYKVPAMSNKRFELLAPSADLGGALLTDIELLLDHAAEHQVFLWKQINTDDWISPAWLAVTFYYWSFYLTLAVTRLTGRTAWHLTTDATKVLKALGPAQQRAPGAGCFRFTCGAIASITDRTLILEKAKLRIHEEIWRLWLDGCDRRVKALANRSGSSLEERLFTAFARSGHNLGIAWPSAFRNAVNYRTGFAYTAVRRISTLGTVKYLKKPTSYEFSEMLGRFENRLVSVISPNAIQYAPKSVLALLIEFTFLIHALASELHCELVDRHGFDRRWRTRRAEFLDRNGLHDGAGFWPI
jgi:hypothetical protein